LLSAKMQDALNTQIHEEFFSSYLYLSMAAWCESNNFDGFAHWMRMQAQEELFHAMKLYDYVNAVGGKVVLKGVDAPETKWNSPLAMFEASLAHEQFMTKNINAIVDIAHQEKDHATDNMLQWFISEQVEEEATVDSICGKLKMLGDTGHGIFMMDRELDARAAPTPPAAE